MAFHEVEQRLKALMLRAQAGDGQAWRELLTLLSARLAVYFRRRLGADLADEADDLVQETLLAVHGRRMTYDPSQPFTAWAYAVARYKLIDHWRRRRVRRHVPLDEVAETLWAEADGGAEAAADLDRLLGDLPARQEQLVRGVKIEGLSLAEAGARFGMTEGAAKVSLHRALKALMAKVGARGD
ncbi:MAG: sigma-70 family RNA polymerase sigma factor [Phenylobacterium sp.]|jgi:RNA polymerase sigma-70 factor (ECF subfamily)|uniref:sigma-70 family RNA polymerase sigma factor n=1 Tax=unclassified Phenylobacterium TaxID=2640670 RepID=UPI0008D63F9D|nr:MULTISPECIES: sigma-70 family RNA polymerase sigma factor [unclassified Phenylobacterium]MBJ7411906.1 sigma-70 family RNA polymerase sigma factor [Phenylobacterium sp.]OHB31057.1 MAG: RNA polymerase subunit sigma-70 [Phenylobacterium sp. RIFCSPHIGHO2_01_FULL_69_31]